MRVICPGALPSRRGFSLKGMMVPSIEMDGWYLASRVEVVKNAEVLFSELSAIYQRLLHSVTMSTVSWALLSAVLMSGLDASTVTSSANSVDWGRSSARSLM